MSTPDPRSQQLNDLSDCAYRLGMTFGHEAERVEDHARKLEYVQLFDRCFFSVRVAIGLQLRLRREPGLRIDERQDLRVRAERDPPDADPAERTESDFEYERDREREAEPASLPVLLKTLGGIAADAAALAGPEPAALPTLRELLAQMTSEPPAAPARSATGGLRARLAGSATAAVTILAPPSPRGLRGVPPIRRATGPPRR